MSKIKFYEDSAKTNQVYPELDPEEMAQKANIDGYYEEMTVGAADNLTGRGDGVPAKFLYRTAGGEDDIADGIATIQTIKGNTIIWNQLLRFGRYLNAFVGYFDDWATTSVLDESTHTITATTTRDFSNLGYSYTFKNEIIPNHKYYVHMYLNSTSNTVAQCNYSVMFSYNWVRPGTELTSHTNTGTEIEFAGILTATSNDRVRLDIRCFRYNDSVNQYKTGDKFIIRNPMLIDLTSIFGGGNEPTAEECKKIFSLNYYEYNYGQFLNFNATALKTVGFNQWNEEWELGIWNSAGNKEASTLAIRSKDYIKVFPSTDYYIKNDTSSGIIIRCYDANKNFLQTIANIKNQIVTLPDKCYYITICTFASDGIKTYPGDWCINLSWSGYRNGEYESYWEYTRDLPISTYFPNGMASCTKFGSAVNKGYDEITNHKAIKRVWQYTFKGTENWALSPQYANTFILNATAIFPRAIALGELNDKSYSSGVGVTPKSTHLAYTGTIYITDTSYPTVEEWKQHLANLYNNNIPLQIKATLYNSDPNKDQYTVETDIEIPLNLSYKVSDFGTEEILPENTSTPTTSEFSGNILYGMNAVDTLRRLPINYISKDSMSNFLGELSDSTQSNWTAEYNEDTGEYNYETDLDLSKKANIDGYYEEMTVGAADNLTGKGDGVPAIFTRRTAGGDEDIADGVATIKSIKGNTLVFNQLSKLRGNETDISGWETWASTYAISQTNKTITVTNTRDNWNNIGICYDCKEGELIAGHKYYYSVVLADWNITAESNPKIFRVALTKAWNGSRDLMNKTAQQGAKYRCIFTMPDMSSLEGAFFRFGHYLDYMVDDTSKYVIGDTFTLKYPMLIDLTKMFGAGNEPSTTEEFETLFYYPYYNYELGRFINYNAESLKTVGFNQWDEEWERGTYNTSTGEKSSYNGAIRSVNYIPIFPNTAYNITKPNGKYTRVFYYDINKNFISAPDVIWTNQPTTVFTTPENAYYMNFFVYYPDGNYQNDVCINLSWSGYRNGEYEPYWERTKELPNQQYFPDGMNSTRAYYDEIQENKVIQRTKMALIDGTKSWMVVTAQCNEQTLHLEIIPVSSDPMQEGLKQAINENKLLSTFGSVHNVWTNTDTTEGVCTHNDRRLQLRIRRDRLTTEDAAGVKAYLTEHPFYIVYALETPIETDISEPLNLSYKVSDFGTEEILPENTDTIVTSPFNGNIAYGINASDTIRRLPESYISEESMEAFLNALNTATNGTWAMAYNSSTGKYVFTFTPNSENQGGN